MNHTVTLRNTGEKEINDVRIDHKYFLEGYEHNFYIRPKSKFWRLGLRFNFDRNGSSWSLNHRYNDSQVRHFEVCVGTRENDQWQNPDLIQLQQYNIPDASNALYASKGYEEGSEVLLTVRKQNNKPGRIEVIVSFGSQIHKSTDLDLGFLEVFDVFAWADFIDFELECEVRPKLIPVKIDLNSIKALSNQKLTISVDDLAVFFGKNNSGKTSVLVGACNTFMNKNHFIMDYLGINRVHTESNYKYELEDLDKYQREDHQRENRKRRSGNSVGQNQSFDWLEELALQDTETRERIVAWMNEHFETWSFEEIKKGRYTSGLEVKVNNVSPLEQGTGAKAVLPIIIQLFNPRVTLLAIDEPELGLEPRMQKIIFQAIKEASQGANGFPLKRVLLATHSHLFLDRKDIQNNFSIQKVDNVVNITQLKETEELHTATFLLLGSNPTDLFFPSNVVIVEGRSDRIFLNAMFQLGKNEGLFKSENLAFHFLDGYDKLKEGAEAIAQMLKTQSYVPVYRDRICGLFDQPHRKGKLIQEIRDLFKDDSKRRFIELDKPAIEFYYPLAAVNKAFNVSLTNEEYEIIVQEYLSGVQKNPPYRGDFLGETLSKVMLAEKIIQHLSSKDLTVDSAILAILKTADDLAFK
ncbi:MAG: ATP-dependent nuclease [Bacteroidota bacterium]